MHFGRVQEILVYMDAWESARPRRIRASYYQRRTFDLSCTLLT